jgi:DivIVA domain-containing protein
MHVVTELPRFRKALRGYDPAAVEDLVDAAEVVLGSSHDAGRTALVQRLGEGLPLAFRGYDRAQVDAYLDGVRDRLSRGPSSGG